MIGFDIVPMAVMRKIAVGVKNSFNKISKTGFLLSIMILDVYRDFESFRV